MSAELNFIDLDFITPRQQFIREQIQNFLNKNHFKQVRIYIEDKDNTFLGIALSLYNYQNIYIHTEIIIPAIQEHSIYDIENDSDFNQCDGIIMFKQIGDSNKNDIHFAEDIIKNKKAAIVTFETKSDYGVYDVYSMGMYIDPLW